MQFPHKLKEVEVSSSSGISASISLLNHRPQILLIQTCISYKGIAFQSTFVYGEPDHTKKLAIWNEITALQPPSALVPNRGLQ